jgi:hypothetical protein
MINLRRVLVVSLFVLLSAVLFAALLKPVLLGVSNCYTRLGFSPPWELFLTLVEVITLSVSTALTAGAFLLVALVTRRRSS